VLIVDVGCCTLDVGCLIWLLKAMLKSMLMLLLMAMRGEMICC